MKLLRLFTRYQYRSRYYNFRNIRIGTLPLLIWMTSNANGTGIGRNKNKNKNKNNNNNNNKKKKHILPPKMDEWDEMDAMDAIFFESIYFPTKQVHVDIEPNANVTYNLCHSFSSIINGYKMAEVPSSTILRELFSEELEELNKFSERKMVDHKFVHNKEYMRFHVILKPFSWLKNIPIINYIFDISITANEDWIIDWKQHRAECLITNESLRWSFSVDELVIIQGITHNKTINNKTVKKINKINTINTINTTHTKLHKELYVNTFIPIPSIMFSNYKQYSDAYIDVITKLAALRCPSSSYSSSLLTN